MIKRGEVFYANLSPVVGSEQGGIRPVLIIQNNKGNLFSPTLIVAPITRNVSKRLQPTQVLIEIPHNECRTPSLILLEQIRTLDKERMLHKVCQLSREEMEQVNQALKVLGKRFLFLLKWFPNIRFSRIVKEEAITWIKFVMEL